MKEKILKIEDVKVEEKYYPRDKWDFVTRARYYNAMKSGAVFPNIDVAEKNGKYYLIDGQHRLLASKDNKGTHIPCNVYNGLTDKEIYLKAVESNVTHGRQFSTREIVRIAVTLKEFDMSQEEISQIIRIPAEKINPFVAKRITSIYGQDTPEVLKNSIKHLAGGELSESPNQNDLSGDSQGRILSNVITLIGDKLLDMSDDNIEKLLKIQELIIELGLKPQTKEQED